MVIHLTMTLHAPFGVCMPPPRLIDLCFHYRTNMVRKNDFAKFFSHPFSVHLNLSTFTHAFQFLLYPPGSQQLGALPLADPLGTTSWLHPRSSARLGRTG